MLASLLDPSVLLTVRATLVQAGFSTAISVALGVGLGMVLARLAHGRSRAWVWLLLSIPFSVPSVIAASAWTTIFGWSAFADWGYSLRAVVIAHVFLNVPLVAFWVWRAIERVPLAEIELARSVGASAVGVWRAVVWPRMLAATGTAAIQVFHLCASSFAIVMILGGGPAVQTLETAIFAEVRFGIPDLSRAGALAAWQVLIQMIPWIVMARLGRVETPFEERRGGASSWLAIPLAAFWLIPYLTLFGAPSMAPEVLSSAGISFLIAFAVAAFSLVGAGAGLLVMRHLERRGWMRLSGAWWLALQAPAAFSSLVLSLLAVAIWPELFGWGAAAVVLVQAILFVPLAVRLLWGEFRAPATAWHELARSLGASPLQRWRAIEWPRWRVPALSVGAWIAVAALGEIAVWSFFQPAGAPSLPALLARWMGQYRFDEAQGAVVALLGLAIGVLLLARRGLRGAL